MMAEYSKDSTWTIESKELELTCGLMDEFTVESGIKANSTVKVFILFLRATEL